MTKQDELFEKRYKLAKSNFQTDVAGPSQVSTVNESDNDSYQDDESYTPSLMSSQQNRRKLPNLASIADRFA